MAKKWTISSALKRVEQLVANEIVRAEHYAYMQREKLKAWVPHGEIQAMLQPLQQLVAELSDQVKKQELPLAPSSRAPQTINKDMFEEGPIWEEEVSESFFEERPIWDTKDEDWR